MSGRRAGAISWSGGKDSCAALSARWRVRRRAMITMFDEGATRSRSHGLRPEVLTAQADRLGLRRVTGTLHVARLRRRLRAALASRADGGHARDLRRHHVRRASPWAERMCDAARPDAVEPSVGSSTGRLFEEWIRIGRRRRDRHARAGLPRRHWLGPPLRREMLDEFARSASIRAANAANTTPSSRTRRCSTGRCRSSGRTASSIRDAGRSTVAMRSPHASRPRHLVRATARRPRHVSSTSVSLECARRDRRLLGPNGSGKTTLLRSLAGILRRMRPRLDRRPADRAADAARLARRIAVVPQETHSTFDFSVIDMVLMGRYPHLGAFELERPSDQAIAREALAATGNRGFEARPFATLSGGEKQRVVIAGALAQASDDAAARRADRRRSTSRYQSRSPRCSRG
jgi:ABC-type uncharacterized transport system YnjBCD ATPase subunit/diphthamide synthase (EF-2-diphthine--ammonia ligase)